jgi:hypothetical protein
LFLWFMLLPFHSPFSADFSIVPSLSVATPRFILLRIGSMVELLEHSNEPSTREEFIDRLSVCWLLKMNRGLRSSRMFVCFVCGLLASVYVRPN